MEGEIESTFPEDVQQIAPPPSSPAARARRNGSGASVAAEMQERDDRGTRDWIDAIVGGEAPVKVNIYRKKPVLGANGENIGGSLETTEDRIDDDYIRETWGGGDFRLSVLTMRPNGQFKIFQSRSIKIGGPPKMNGQLTNGGGGTVAVVTEEKSGLAERAFDTMAQNAREAQNRADRIERESRQHAPAGLDVAALQALNAPLVEQLRAAQAETAALRHELVAMSNKPAPTDPFRDQMLTHMLQGESGRLETLRAQYEARLDKLRDNHEDHIKRLEDRHTDEIKRLEARHNRELDQVAKSVEMSSKGSSVAYDARIDSLKSEISRLERDLAAAGTKMATLEARKDQTIGEKADELIKVKEALDGIGGGGDDKDEPWYERVINAVGNSEAALSVISKFAGQPATPQQQQQIQQQPQLPPPGVPFQTGDGNVYVRDQNGNVTIIDQQAMRQQRALQQKQQAARAKKRAAAQPTQQAVATQEAPDEEGGDGGAEEDDTPGAEEMALELNPAEVKIAISFMENAIKNNTPPEQFAQTARNLVPGDVLSFIAQHGIRKLFSLIRLDTGSPLTTVAGRQFADRVAKVLVGDQ